MVSETEFLATARETDAAVQILFDHSQLNQAIELVETYPDLSYLFDHFAHADPETPTDEGTFSQFATLAEHETVAVKVSEIPHMSDAEFPYADMHDHVRWYLEQFGRDRVIWGSDYPNVSDVATYAETRHWLDRVDTLSSQDVTWLTSRSFDRHVGP